MPEMPEWLKLIMFPFVVVFFAIIVIPVMVAAAIVEIARKVYHG